MAKILIIDDEAVIRSYLQTVVQRLGHDVVLAEEGGEALEKSQAPDIEMILCDLRLPGNPAGMDLVRRIREYRPNCPIVVISGYPTEDRLEECEKLGIRDFLTKPFEVGFLRSIVEKQLGSAPGK
jgi:DNA-binding NtrC family response regulator